MTNPMVAKLAGLWPEITMLSAAAINMLVGLAPSACVRKFTGWITAAALVAAAALAAFTPPPDGSLPAAFFIRQLVPVVGFLLLLVTVNVPDSLRFTRDSETGAEPRSSFDPANVMRGEFMAFFLFSLVGVMLAAGATDLAWLFLALELTSLPTYIMVATARDKTIANESGVKYFFLGALAAAVFLYGFTLIYGATGFTDFYEIQLVAKAQLAKGGLSPMFTMGILLAVIGISFKIAAVPMHFYTADVYQGATTPVTAFLAFVPKTAGFVSLIAVLGFVGWPLPPGISWAIWLIAAFTMTIGNVLGLLQTSVKRALAYSSIAHSGYMLVGLLAGPIAVEGSALGNGVAGVLFYLVAYGLATIAAFAVLGSIEARGDEADSYEDISGLVKREPTLAAVMLLALLSLVGLPPLVGFLGKIYLFGSAIAHSGKHPEYVLLVVIAVINSAISAVYYLRIASAIFFGQPSDDLRVAPVPLRRAAAAIAALLALMLGFAGRYLVDYTGSGAPSGTMQPKTAQATEPTAKQKVASAVASTPAGDDSASQER